MTHYIQRTDGEGFVVPVGEVYRLACCQCGLVHDVAFASQDGKPIGMAVQVNNRATAQRRRRLQQTRLGFWAKPEAAFSQEDVDALEVLRATRGREYGRSRVTPNAARRSALQKQKSNG